VQLAPGLQGQSAGQLAQLSPTLGSQSPLPQAPEQSAGQVTPSSGAVQHPSPQVLTQSPGQKPHTDSPASQVPFPQVLMHCPVVGSQVAPVPQGQSIGQAAQVSVKSQTPSGFGQLSQSPGQLIGLSASLQHPSPQESVQSAAQLHSVSPPSQSPSPQQPIEPGPQPSADPAS
jgi:hypothetical protein